MLKVAVLISGNGTNLQALIDACKADDFPAEIVLVLSNKKDAYGLVRAKEANIPTAILSHKDFEDREQFDKAMHKKLIEHGVELVCLAGFMRVLTDKFVKKWHDKLINIHPSLLPAFPGLNVQQAAIDTGVKVSGCTVHFVRTKVDAGPIIAQSVVPVYTNDTAETLSARILEVEHQCYPLSLKMIAQGKLEIKNEIVYIKP